MFLTLPVLLTYVCKSEWVKYLCVFVQHVIVMQGYKTRIDSRPLWDQCSVARTVVVVCNAADGPNVHPRSNNKHAQK